MPKQIGGNVYWIENGQRTSRVVEAEVAFGDPAQAREQVLFAESSGDKELVRLARLAYRQFQAMRYRGENKTPRRTAKVGQQKVLKAKKSLKTKSTEKPRGRKRSKKRA
jgi:hypothetical protein